MGKSCSEASEFAEWYANGAMNKTSTLIKHRLAVLCICKSKMIKYL